jgi:hypothetical protein
VTAKTGITVVGSAKPDRIVLQASAARAKVTGGAGNDVIRLAGSRIVDVATVRAGAGNDTVIGGSGDDVIGGDAGRDRLVGAAGDDLFTTADGVSGPVDADDIDGGSGVDGVSFAKRRRGVTVDLRRSGAVQGATRERDRIRHVEDVTGTAAADTITGTNADNTLRGMGGADTITGLGGDDELSGNDEDPRGSKPSADRLDGGEGDDTLIGLDNAKSLLDPASALVAADAVVCGGGADTVTPDRLDVLPGDCEFVTDATDSNDLVTASLSVRPILTGNVATFTARCDGVADPATGCAMAITVDGTTQASVVPTGAEVAVAVTLSDATAAKISAPGGATLPLTLNASPDPLPALPPPLNTRLDWQTVLSR